MPFMPKREGGSMTKSIGYLSWPLFVSLCVFCFASLWLVVTLVWQSQKVKREAEIKAAKRPPARFADVLTIRQVIDGPDEIPFMLDTIDDRDDFLRDHGVGNHKRRDIA